MISLADELMGRVAVPAAHKHIPAKKRPWLTEKKLRNAQRFLVLWGRGWTPKEIASHYGFHQHTVTQYIRWLRAKGR
jgi:DNA-binding NarL/FixJ family response regulator